MILASVPRGVERRAARELKEMVLYHLREVEGDEEGEDSAPLTLDEELELLRKKKPSSGGSKFGIDVFDSDVTGLIVVSFRSSERTERPQKQAKTDVTKTDVTSSSSIPPSHTPTPSPSPSQPRAVVNTVVDALVAASLSLTSTAPESRYILRVIPLMVSCYFDLEEIRVASASVLSAIEDILEAENLPKASFGIQVKRRLSNKLPKKEELISLIAGQFDTKSFEVDLDDPDFTIFVEVIKNVVGIGYVRGYKSKKRMNLLELTTGDVGDGNNDDNKKGDNCDVKKS